jgi:tetratricopeptide (TPR) repeat protein
MITELGRLHPESLSVIARASVMRYKKGDTPVDRIGQELGVNYVLEGSSLREGNLVRINAVLIQVADQTQIWADSYKREFAGILDLQSEVAESVAQALSIKLLPSEKATLAKARPVDPEAHEAYLRGTNKLLNATPEDIDAAEKYFDQALEKDPAYALAYSGRACVWLFRNQAGLTAPGEAGPKAKAAALRAIELDANSADAHHMLASVRTYIDWDWDGAGESWCCTLELNPNIALAQALYAHFLAITGHVEEARAHSEKAAALDPFNPLVQSFHAQVLYAQHRYDEALAVAREAQRVHPDHPIVGFTLWVIMHEKKGMEEEAFKAIKAFVGAIYQDPGLESALEEGYAHGGYAEAMKRGAEALIARLPEAYSLPNDIGNFYLAAGEKDKAIEWLEKGVEVHDPVSPYLSCFPLYDDIRSHPRIQDILRRMGLPMDEKK